MLQSTLLLLGLHAASAIRPLSDAGVELKPLDDGDLSESTGFTRLRFSLQDSQDEAFSEPSAFLQMDESDLMELRREVGPERQQALWQKEIGFFLSQKAVQEVWQFFYKVFDFSDLPEAGKITELLKRSVPGLESRWTFGHVFNELQKAGCPIWLVGGTVRDIIGGSSPNDVDCAALCDTSRIAQVARRWSWKHEAPKPGQYFSIGNAHGPIEKGILGIGKNQSLFRSKAI